MNNINIYESLTVLERKVAEFIDWVCADTMEAPSVECFEYWAIEINRIIENMVDIFEQRYAAGKKDWYYQVQNAKHQMFSWCALNSDATSWNLKKIGDGLEDAVIYRLISRNGAKGTKMALEFASYFGKSNIVLQYGLVDNYSFLNEVLTQYKDALDGNLVCNMNVINGNGYQLPLHDVVHAMSLVEKVPDKKTKDGLLKAHLHALSNDFVESIAKSQSRNRSLLK